MGASSHRSNSHGKKSDKECQSPMLKIFKDIMQKEKYDPEKTNLLVNKKEDRKKKFFSSRNKSERRTRESSSSEQRKRSPCKAPVVAQRTDFDDRRTRSIPFQNEKRDSWFFWGETEKPKQTEDTCSCVSCALKKIVSSEYACVGCLLVLLTISIVVAFLMVCKNVPTLTATEKSAKWDHTSDSDRLKRKIDILNKQKNEYGSAFDDNSNWKDSPAQMNGLSGIAGSEFGSSFRELNAMDDESRFSGDLSSILDGDKVKDLQNSERLKDFYRKLMKTDTQIRNLKKTYAYPDFGSSMMKTQDRIKRSLLRNHFKKKAKDTKVIKANKSFNKTANISTVNHGTEVVKHRRFKRVGNLTEQPMGFVIEKKKVLIQYKPTNLKKVAKCSHTPKDSNTHEKQLKHPFYKNTQRLDELLDKFLTQNMPEIMADPFGLDKLFQSEKDKVKHVKQTEPLKKQMQAKEDKYYSNSDIMKILRTDTTTEYQKDIFKQQSIMFNEDKSLKQKAITKSDYDIMLSVSTILNPGLNRIGKTPLPLLDKVPNIRRLLQIESADDENLAYEELQEVATDGLHNHDEFDRSSHERQKKKDESEPEEQGHIKHNPMDVHNPNWKGPMPLYPDELNAVVKPTVVNNNKVAFPVNTKDIKSEIDKTEKDLNDLEYVEDYLNNKYDKLVEMAQAYSDYGVLDGKKVEKEKNSAADEKTEHRVKLSVDTGILKRGTFQGKKKNPHESDPSEKVLELMNSNNKYNPSEGIRFELRPTSNSREDVFDLSKMLKSHLKIKPEDYIIKFLNFSNSDLNDLSTYPYLEMTYSTDNYNINKLDNQDTTTDKILNPDASPKNGIFSFGKGKRALLSINLESDTDIDTTTTATDAIDKNTDEEYYEDTTLYQVTYYVNSDGKNIGNETESYLTEVVHDKDDKNNETDVTDKTGNTFETLSSAYENKVTAAVNIKTTDLQNTSSKISIINCNLTDTTNLEIDALSKVKKNINYHKIDEFETTLRTNHSATENDSSQLKLLLVSDEDDQTEEDYPDNYSFPIVLYFNEDTNDNKSNIELKIIVPNDENEIKINNVTLNKRDVLNKTEQIEDAVSKLGSNNDNIDEYGSVMTENSKDTDNHTVVNNNNSFIFNNKKKEISVSEFFHLMSDLFVALEGDNSQQTSNSSVNATEPMKTTNGTNTTDTINPIYDSEMFANIGHRSRVLLSVNLPNITDKSETDDANVAGVKNTDVGNLESHLLNTSIPTKLNTSQERDANTIANSKEKDANINTNRSIVKRNADNSNLIFWNDIYDEEYGVETERLDNAMRDKNSITDNSFIKKSGKWMQGKIKQLAQNLKKPQQTTTEETPTEKNSRDTQELGTDTQPQYVYDTISNKIRKRQAENDEDDYETNQKSIFASMTSNMKEICKKAAQAVQRTRNIEVREDSKQETIATSLMQQLVRLMNDLVNYQVQQKTCAKLPPDLQNFLEWLTSPDDEKSEGGAQPVTFRNSYQDDILPDLNLGTVDDKTMNQPSSMFANENTDFESKTECLGTLHDVQDLIRQYEAMTDEDKSKMTGVKKYLEDQLDYLSKRITSYNDYNIYNTDYASLRFKRDLTPRHRFKRKLKKKLHKFMKNFGKKHTRTTVNYYDAVQITECNRNTDTKSVNTIQHDGDEKGTNGNAKEIDKNDQTNDFNENKEFNSRKEKRNLRDVYYKAIQEARRLTTADAMQTNVRKGRHDGNKDVKRNRGTVKTN